ncbi:MAG: hypothetical protein ACI898_002301 [Flavobacteriales bacterium]|jgi:hypothetical protein
MHHNPNIIASLQRLRIGHQIMGYRRLENDTAFFSKDLFWWDGINLPFTNIDEATRFKTKTNRVLFVNDIIEVTESSWFGLNHSKKQFRIANENDSQVLINIKDNSYESMDYLNDVLHYSFLSYVFINPDVV